MKDRTTLLYRIYRLFPGVFALLVVIIVQLPVSLAAADAPEGQMVFSSPQQAVEAMVSALQNGDDTELLAILGPESEDLVYSGDEVADRNGRARFLKAYEEKHRFELGEKDGMVLIVGDKDYPFPIPLVQRDDAWLFDTPSGHEEILNRRIGRNELHTIEVMKAYTDAQREYACIQRESGSEFAQRFTSTDGNRDGLYWKAEEGEPQSPFGPLIAEATEEGYSGDLDREPPEPFHGYYFKILKSQGKHAKGGAFDYVAGGKMVLGFALVAYPSKYGSSGIMTFLVNQEGVIYEKDLGPETGNTAAALTSFDPDDTWKVHEEKGKD